MSVTRLFVGYDTFGKAVQVAQRNDGVWFSRSMVNFFNRSQFTKWREYKDPEFTTHGINEYSGERFEYTKPVMMWGFNVLREVQPEGVRLPKAVQGIES